MKAFSKSLKGAAAAILGLSAAVCIALAGGNASALSCYPYVSGNTHTSATPVFNNICGVPSLINSSEGQYPIGDETDFVRIRPNISGDPTNSAANPKLQNSLSSACNAGDKFDIWTYIHNDANPDLNNNGSGSAVAQNTKVALTAPLNSQASSFNFGSTVSASNAASVSDGATLNCNGKQVKLTLVAKSVHYNNNLNQTGYNQMADSAVNGTTAVGSPVWGNGQVWGCWDYRIVVVYQVTITEVTPPQQAASCDLLDITADNRTVKITNFKTSVVNGATFNNATVDWGDNSDKFTSSNIVGKTHDYSKDGTYTITATANFTVNGQPKSLTSATCTRQVTFTPGQPPVVPPVTPPTTTTTTTTPPTPTRLVNTGAGSVAGLFAAATLAGTAAYRKVLSRRLSDV